MKIIIDNIIFRWQKSGGISVVWHELIKRMLKMPTTFLYKFIEYQGADRNLFHKDLALTTDYILYTKKNRDFWIGRYLNESIKQVKDKFIFHSTYYRTCSNPKAINIVTIHDFTYERYCKGIKKWIHSWTKKHALKKADYIICISENTKNDLLKFVKDINSKKITVIYNGASDDFYKIEDDNQRYHAEQENYLVFVGSRAPYKNFKLAVQVAAAANMRLKIVGSKLKDYEKIMTKNIIGCNYDELGYIDNCVLNKLYNKAFALIYPSAYEGFGLPVVEAQKAGCPVLALNNSSLSEVIGDKEQLVNQPIVSSFCKQIEKLKIETYRKRIIQKGLTNAQQFTWDNTFSKYIELYQQIVADLYK